MTLRHAAFCIALAALIPAAPALAQNTTPVKPATGTPATPTPPAASTTAPPVPAAQPAGAASTAPAKKLTPAQTALHDRQTACGAEWRTAKEAGKIPAGQTWPKFWSACNKRLKAQGK